MNAARPLEACPECKETLRLATDAATGRVSGFCPRCRGRWTTIEDARRLQRIPPGPLSPPKAPVRIARCPICVDQWLVPSAAMRGVGVRPLYCTRCEGIWLPNVAPALALQAERDERTTIRLGTTPAFAPVEDVVENHPGVFALAAVVVAALAWLVASTGGGAFLLSVSVRMAAHEMGHAIASLLSGIWAVPLPFFTANAGDASASALIAMTVAIALTAWHGLRQRLVFWCALAAVAFVLLVVNGYGGDPESREIFFTAAGFEGEFVLGTLLVVASFHRLWRHPSWDVAKYAYLVFGMATLVGTAHFWGLVAAEVADFPMGSAFGGYDDAGGDLNKLLAAGWTLDDILARALALRSGCLAIVGAYIGVFAMRGLLRWRARRRVAQSH